MATDLDKEKERLRSYLNPSIRGPNTDAILEALATGSCHLIDNVEAVYDSLYVVTAQERYLDQRLAGKDLSRPDNVGLSDEVFREIGIDVTNRKQIRDQLLNLLRIIYGEEFTRATLVSTAFETYQLSDGDNLIIQFDDQDEVEVFFDTNQFSSIAAATAQEVADAITKEIRRLGRTGSAIAKDNGAGGFVELISDTDGPSSSIRVLGGSAQNKLKFEDIRPTSGDATTQWTFSVVAGGSIRLTWTGGATPSLGRVRVNDYVNIFGSAFDDGNKGTFTITAVQSGAVNDAYVEFENPNGVAETQLQGTDDGILFFNALRSTINRKNNFASTFQVSSGILEIFLPATTRVVRRDRQGAAYLQESGASTEGNEGPYTFDESAPYVIGGEECNTTTQLDASTSNIIDVDDATDIPDEPGSLIFGWGTSKEEGPVPYISRPSSTTIILDPSYTFQNVHDANTNISLVSQDFPYEVEDDAEDYPFYITDVVSGRIYAEELIELVRATGIQVILTILYPGDEGLGKYDTDNSEETYVWGPDPS